MEEIWNLVRLYKRPRLPNFIIFWSVVTSQHSLHSMEMYTNPCSVHTVQHTRDHHCLQVEKATIERLSQSHVVLLHCTSPSFLRTPTIHTSHKNKCQKTLIKVRQAAAKQPIKDCQTPGRRISRWWNTNSPGIPNPAREQMDCRPRSRDEQGRTRTQTRPPDLPKRRNPVPHPHTPQPRPKRTSSSNPRMSLSTNPPFSPQDPTWPAPFEEVWTTFTESSPRTTTPGYKKSPTRTTTPSATFGQWWVHQRRWRWTKTRTMKTTP